MRVCELMTAGPVVVEPERTIADAIDLMDENAVRHLPVVERGELIGVLSDRDALDATGRSPDRLLEADRRPKVVRDFMTAPVETVEPEEDVEIAIERLLARRVDCLPVVEPEGRLVGLLSVADLVAAEVRACSGTEAVGALDAVVASVMSAPPFVVDTEDTVSAALEACLERRVRHLPVQSEGWFVGILSDRDLRLRVARGEGARRLGDVMTTGVASLGPDSLLSDAAELMQSRGFDAVPVTDAGRLVGIVTTTDVLAFLRGRLSSAP